MKLNIISFVFILLTSALYSQGTKTPVYGVQKIAIIPFDYLQDGEHVTLEDIDKGYFSSDYSVKKFIEEISYGRVSIEGDVYPYRKNMPPLYGTGYTNCFPNDSILFNQPDVDYSQYDGIVVVVHDENKGGGCPAGISTFGKITLNTKDGTMDLRRSGFRDEFYFPHDFSRITNSTVAHEIMHSFGVPYHSNSFIKINGEYTLQAYGNLFDIMGLRQQASHPCALIKKQKGWLDETEIKEVINSGTYKIYPLERHYPEQTQCIIVPLKNKINLQPNAMNPVELTHIYLEYRDLTGFDSRNARAVILSDNSRVFLEDEHGLYVVGADCQRNDFCIPILLDCHPEPLGGVGAAYGPHEASDAHLKLGETYKIPENEISLTVKSILPEEYLELEININIDYDGDGFISDNDCDDSNPDIHPDAEEIPNNGIDEDCDGMDLVTSVHELLNSTISIYPNPANTFVNIDVTGNLNYKSSLFDLEGKMIKSSYNSNHIKIETIPQGTYILQVKDLKTGQKIYERIVIGR